MFSWSYNSTSNIVLTTAYSIIPSLYIDANTGKSPDYGFGSQPIAGLTKISSTQLKYTSGSSSIIISRGSLVKTANGYNYYQVCFE